MELTEYCRGRVAMKKFRIVNGACLFGTGRRSFRNARVFVLLRQHGEPSGLNRIFGSIGRKASAA